MLDRNEVRRGPLPPAPAAAGELRRRAGRARWAGTGLLAVLGAFLVTPGPLAAQTILTTLKTGGGDGHNVESVIFSPDGKTLAAVVRDPSARGRVNSFVRLWDLKSGKEKL